MYIFGLLYLFFGIFLLSFVFSGLTHVSFLCVNWCFQVLICIFVVRFGQFLKWLLLVALIQVEFTRSPRAWCRNFMYSFRVVAMLAQFTALIFMLKFLGTFLVLVFPCKNRSHNYLCLFLAPCHSTLCFIIYYVHCCLIKVCRIACINYLRYWYQRSFECWHYVCCCGLFC